MPAETTTYDLAHVVERTGAPSQDWLRRKLNAGLIPGRRAGRTWRMTESDMAALVEFMARPARPRSVADSTPGNPLRGKLTARSQRVLQQRSA